MQMIYRGVAYSPSVVGVPTQEKKETATFLGQTYQLRQTQVGHQPSEQLMYRGVRYGR